MIPQQGIAGNRLSQHKDMQHRDYARLLAARLAYILCYVWLHVHD